VGATTVFVAVVSRLVRAGPEAEAEAPPPPPPRAVVPERNVEGEGVLTITVVEVTVLEEPGRVKVVREVIEPPGAPGLLEAPGTPGRSVEMAPGMLTEALTEVLKGDGTAVRLTLGYGIPPEGIVGTADVSSGQGTSVVYVLVVVIG
jgi:hypothetical protein